MNKLLKQRYKKYLIEFLIIVLGVTISFMAEQGRQSINESFETKDLVKKAIAETKFLLLCDSFKVSFKARSFIERMASGKSYRPDSMHLVLLNGVKTYLRLEEYFPCLFALTKRTDLTTGQLYIVKTAAAITRQYIEREEDHLKLIQQMQTRYLDYGIANDLNRLQNVNLQRSKIKQEVIYWNPLEYNVNYSGRYDLFVQDKEVLLILQKLHFNLTEQELLMVGLKALQKDIEQNGDL